MEAKAKLKAETKICAAIQQEIKMKKTRNKDVTFIVLQKNEFNALK